MALIRAQIVAAVAVAVEATAIRSNTTNGCCLCDDPNPHVTASSWLFGCRSMTQTCEHFSPAGGRCTEAGALNSAIDGAKKKYEDKYKTTCEVPKQLGRCDAILSRRDPVPPYTDEAKNKRENKPAQNGEKTAKNKQNTPDQLFHIYLNGFKAGKGTMHGELADKIAQNFERKIVEVKRDDRTLTEFTEQIIEGNAGAFEIIEDNAGAFEEECADKAEEQVRIEQVRGRLEEAKASIEKYKNRAGGRRSLSMADEIEKSDAEAYLAEWQGLEEEQREECYVQLGAIYPSTRLWSSLCPESKSRDWPCGAVRLGEATEKLCKARLEQYEEEEATIKTSCKGK